MSLRNLTSAGNQMKKVSFLAIVFSLFASQALAVTTNWASLTLPSSYPNAAVPLSDTNPVGGDRNFTYATGARGTVIDPATNQAVGFTVSGEVASWKGGNWIGTPGSGVYTSNVYTNATHVGTMYINGSGPAVTTPQKMINQTGFTLPEWKSHTITFDRPVSNVLMAISSLGAFSPTPTLSDIAAKHSSLQFNRPFTILSSNNGASISVGGTQYDRFWYGPAVATTTAPVSGTTAAISTSPTAPFLGDATSGYYLSGYEGSGIIQFLGGPYTSISWTVTAPEVYSGINIGFSSNPFTTDATLPGTYTFPANVLPPTYTIGGTVSGLAGQSLVLRNNGTNDLTVASNGSFVFSLPVNSGSSYAVTVVTQPAGQTCTVGSGSGTANADVINVAVNCTNNAYTVGGSVSGLASNQTVVLLNNNVNSITVTVNGSFTFSDSINSGSAYAVTVGTQPAGQTCSVANGSGTASSNVTTVSITCTTNPPTPIPTLSEWVMIFMASLMALSAIRGMRRQ